MFSRKPVLDTGVMPSKWLARSPAADLVVPCRPFYMRYIVGEVLGHKHQKSERMWLPARAVSQISWLLFKVVSTNVRFLTLPRDQHTIPQGQLCQCSDLRYATRLGECQAHLACLVSFACPAPAGTCPPYAKPVKVTPFGFSPKVTSLVKRHDSSRLVGTGSDSYLARAASRAPASQAGSVAVAISPQTLPSATGSAGSSRRRTPAGAPW